MSDVPELSRQHVLNGDRAHFWRADYREWQWSVAVTRRSDGTWALTLIGGNKVDRGILYNAVLPPYALAVLSPSIDQIVHRLTDLQEQSYAIMDAPYPATTRSETSP